ncbi:MULTISPECIES: aminofutalosine synthase MqnE [unclassified Paenibacillus]|uniref:aminofutalosine synthase MqnE n=1 Tax=unclassified Paenibacillus TaxID=185978 RepID=UPI001AE1DFDB|nr:MULTISPECIES: aminofutalosine synthase MqnE [unclassified Paenibacillus]MBP1154367.1 aminodeoxyfutalosine synthase [Paenibacillus sp. PvP091]MBP1170249.1 aminodeoxyfutalosine synthase [Paenibacillus sp. PvR098]MBP2441277.1 aminodeoxyfutalosine synthase [Paenibacillus sp. PvP052]
MTLTVQSSSLDDIRDKVMRGERLSFEDGVRLMKSDRLLEVGMMADMVRRRINGDHVYFIVNTHLNYTNVCYLDCKLCAFGLKPDNPRSYTLSLEQLEEKFKGMVGKNFTELHIVGGVNAKLPFSYYEDMIRLAKRHLPDIHVQAFTAVEVDYIARVSKLSVEETIERLREAGLGSILGGGAEIFDPEIREIISGHKTDSDRWFNIHRKTHSLGMKSNASILYGHIEKPEHVVDHLIRIRELQDETGGFQAFFAFAFHPDNTKLAEEYQITGETTGWYDLKLLAVARLMLDNVPHVRAFWMAIGMKLAQVSLSFGVDDLDGTVMEEQIIHAAGNDSVQMTPKETFINMIREAGRLPVERDTLYNVVRTF